MSEFTRVIYDYFQTSLFYLFENRVKITGIKIARLLKETI